MRAARRAATGTAADAWDGHRTGSGSRCDRQQEHRDRTLDLPDELLTKRPGAAVATSLGVATAAAAAAFVWGVVVERNRFTVRQEVLPILEPGARPLTILHLSDLHMAPWQRAKQEFIRSLARYEPDLVVDTGDNLGHEDGLLGIRHALEPFAGVPGVFVHGSN